jgi:uncharacterized DUF497 family protein
MRRMRLPGACLRSRDGSVSFPDTFASTVSCHGMISCGHHAARALWCGCGYSAKLPALILLDYTYKYTYIGCRVRYTYGPKKRVANLKKHGFDFEDARRVIESHRTVTFEDRRFDYGEHRYITLGVLREVVVVIATAETDEEIRVISMRKADRDEEKIYYQNLG